MGAINGKTYINRLESKKTEIWFDGKRIAGKLSEHPAFKGVVETKASLYDLQSHPEHSKEMTYSSPSTNEPVGLSFLQPETKDDLYKRRKMMERWARHTCGMMGRSPDYLSTVLMSFACSSNILEERENCFPAHFQTVYERARENDLSFTHTFITPQVNRSQSYFEEDGEDPVSARVIEKNQDGLIIKGARLLATQGGLSDEVLVFSAPSKLLFESGEAFAFSIPSDTKGLKFICRDSYVGGNSIFDHPLSSRYEEMDSIIVFDDVLVPWDSVFFYDNPDASNKLILDSSFHHFATHQVLVRQIVKLEFVLGLAELLIETIGVREYLHIQEKVSEIIIGLETMKAMLEKSENDAKQDEHGFMRPSIIPLRVATNIFPKIYPRFAEILQLIGASGMVTLPTENAFHSPIKPDLDKYLKGTNQTAEDKTRIFRLAWDLTMSPFGSRQTQYERYFFGDPVRLAGILYNSYPKQEYVSNIREFLGLKDRG
ncbi:4-hydroxyphenylacetate 3-monooxygenase, oxygenase component [Bacillus sp. P14.5]|uniref:4-hydroxyphenylacetate 3-monooxygenase, oxygenase component n=1 Tax=Bacillus sp. P14.5 TaxID=1983400 RepID=UPI000DEAB768|nr:4-hydroxyphenylacetate 3-monooxygenase, oxygenase component [Bacillus sp. P14.5]